MSIIKQLWFHKNTLCWDWNLKTRCNKRKCKFYLGKSILLSVYLLSHAFRLVPWILYIVRGYPLPTITVKTNFHKTAFESVGEMVAELNDLLWCVTYITCISCYNLHKANEIYRVDLTKSHGLAPLITIYRVNCIRCMQTKQKWKIMVFR